MTTHKHTAGPIRYGTIVCPGGRTAEIESDHKEWTDYVVRLVHTAESNKALIAAAPALLAALEGIAPLLKQYFGTSQTPAVSEVFNAIDFATGSGV